MSKKCDVAAVDCFPVSFKLIIEDETNRQVKPQKFIVRTNKDLTLLQTLQRFELDNPKFRFTTEDDVPTSGAYVKSVNGTANGPDKFWHIVLYDDGNRVIAPNDLCYHVRPNDNVYLKFSYLILTT